MHTSCKLQLDNEQQNALQLMLSGRNVFLTGEAGTGKSAVIHEFENLCRKELVKLAPTGIAARNVNGETIHGFFGFGATILTPESLSGDISYNLRLMLQTVEVILIDEISMVRSDLFYAMDFRLRSACKTQQPFGGKQIIAVGDFLQLPPVVPEAEIHNYLEQTLGSIYAFGTNSWKAARFELLELEKIHRQTDREFANMLSDIRLGRDRYLGKHEFGEKFIGENPYEFEDWQCIFKELNRQCVRAHDNDSIALCCRQWNARAINQAAIDRLPDEGYIFRAKIFGDWPNHAYPTIGQMRLKLNTRVMLLANKPDNNGGFEYVNGDVGKIIDYDIFYGDGDITVKLDRGPEVKVTHYLWVNYKYVIEYDSGGYPHISQYETGTFLQYPLAPAYAMTIHKAQGQTLDRVHLVLDKGCFASGQLYTALSRVRSRQNLTLDRAIRSTDLQVEPEVLDFYGHQMPWECY